MKIKHQLSIATLVFAGVFATGCSQQQQMDGGSQQVEGGSQQVEGGSQQVEGGSQVAGSQQAGSQQQVEPDPDPQPDPQPDPDPQPNQWDHTHPAIPNCTNSVTHTHKYNNARHTHSYGCQGQSQPKPPVDVFALQRKLKAKGYYRGPIDGIVGPGTRSALKRFMQR